MGADRATEREERADASGEDCGVTDEKDEDGHARRKSIGRTDLAAREFAVLRERAA